MLAATFRVTQFKASTVAGFFHHAQTQSVANAAGIVFGEAVEKVFWGPARCWIGRSCRAQYAH